jgi:predicted nucleic acid-binding protein
MVEDAVVDASAVVDLLLGGDLGLAVRDRLTGHRIHAPAHLDAEVLSALGRLHRAGEVEAADVEHMLMDLVEAPNRRHPLPGRLQGAWVRRHQLRLSDGLYVDLTESMEKRLITTDRRLSVVPCAELVEL